MKVIVLYFLIGAIVAVWTAINQNQLEREFPPEESENKPSYMAAYVLIALAWPLSVAVSVYSFVSNLLADDTN